MTLLNATSIHSDEVLRLLAEAVSAGTGEPMWRALARAAAAATQVRCALLGEIVQEMSLRIRTLAVWNGERFADNFEYEVMGGPCNGSQAQGMAHCVEAAACRCPGAERIEGVAAKACLSTDLLDSGGKPIGVLLLMHDQPLPTGARVQAVMQIVAAQAAAELQRQRTEETLRQVRSSFERRLIERTMELSQSNETLRDEIRQRRQATEQLQASETQYRFLVESIPHMIWSAHPDGTGDYFSPRFLEYLGTTPEQMQGWDWLETLHPDDRHRLVSVWKIALQEGTEYRIEVRLRNGRSGEYRWFFSHAVPQRDLSGRIVRWLGTCTDIEDRKRAEETLRQSEQRYRQLVELSPNVIFVQCEGKVVFLNEAGRRLLGVGNLDEIIGQSVLSFQHPDYREAVLNRIAQLLEGKAVPPLEQKYRRMDGTWIDVEVAAAPFTYFGKPAGLVVARDISQYKRAEAALRQSEQQAKEAAESNRRLHQELDHRVRNNLSGLLSLVMLMRGQERDVADFADAMEARLTAMVHAHYLMTRGGGRRMELKGMIASLLDAMKGMARHTIEVRVEGPALCISESQIHPLTMVLLEWYTNSCKYGAHSVPTGRLEVTWEAQPEESETRVRLHWKESGGPRIAQPVRTSLGTDLVRSFVTREMQGTCRLRFDPAGVDHVVEFRTHGRDWREAEGARQ